MKVRKFKRLARRGFTLVEILLVVVILAMLAAFSVPFLLGQSEETKIQLASSQVKTFERDLDRYQLNCGAYPTTEQGLAALVEEPQEEPVPKKWVQTIAELPLDPWGNEYQYAYPGEHNGKKKPDVWSFGPDGEDGTEDDIGNWKADSADDRSSRSEK
jgi:general secretion pathway protein G